MEVGILSHRTRVLAPRAKAKEANWLEPGPVTSRTSENGESIKQPFWSWVPTILRLGASCFSFFRTLNSSPDLYSAQISLRNTQITFSVWDLGGSRE